MLVVISSLFIIGFILLYVLISAATSKAKALAPLIVQTSERYCNDPKFIHYFMSNTAIFVAGVRNPSSMKLYSALFSASKWVALVFAIWNVKQNNWAVLICLIGILAFVFFSNSKRWFYHYDEKNRIIHTLYNWSFFYPEDTDPNNNLLEFPIHILLLEYCNEAVNISKRYFEGTGTITSQYSSSPHNSAISHQSPLDEPSNIINEAIDNSSVIGVINSLGTIPPEYSLRKEDLPIRQLYFALLGKRNMASYGYVFENIFIHIFITSNRNNQKSFFDSFNKSNRFFDFTKYNEKQDDIYAEDDTGLEYDKNYDWKEPETNEDIEAFLEMKADLEEDDKWCAILDRQLIRNSIVEFFDLREKIKEMKISDIASIKQSNQETIRNLNQHAKNETEEIERERERLEKISNSYISMDYSTVHELQRKIFWLERENEILSIAERCLQK